MYGISDDLEGSALFDVGNESVDAVHSEFGGIFFVVFVVVIESLGGLSPFLGDFDIVFNHEVEDEFTDVVLQVRFVVDNVGKSFNYNDQNIDSLLLYRLVHVLHCENFVHSLVERFVVLFEKFRLIFRNVFQQA